MIKEPKREKRRHERVKLILNINWGLTHQCGTDARLTSISPGGCFIQTKFKLLIDQIIFLRLMLRTEHVIQCRVRYTLQDVGSGVAFLDLTEDARSAVQELVDTYRSTPSA
jgi:hypothetical protein